MTTDPGQARTAPAEDLESLSRLLVRARWIAAGAAPPLVLAAWGLMALSLDGWGIAAVVGILVATNLSVRAYSARRLGPDVDPAVRSLRLDAMVRLEIASDVVALTLAFYHLGGIENAVPFLGAFHVAAVGTWLGAREALRVVLAVATGAGIVMMLEQGRAICHWHLMNDWRWFSEREPAYVLVYAAALVAVLLATGWASTSRRPGG